MLGSAKTEKRSLSCRTPEREWGSPQRLQSSQIQEGEPALGLRATSSTGTQDHSAPSGEVKESKHQKHNPSILHLVPYLLPPPALRSHTVYQHASVFPPYLRVLPLSIKVYRKSSLIALVWANCCPHLASSQSHFDGS